MRDLGGYPLRGGGMTARGAFLRSDATGELSPLDIAKLRSMGLSLVIDLRGPGEIVAAPSRLLGLEGVRYSSRPLLDGIQSSGFAGDLPATLAELYISILDGGKARLRSVFEELSSADGLRLFHCSAGKDRTGVVAMLLLELAGAVDEAIVADYASSAANMASPSSAARSRPCAVAASSRLPISSNRGLRTCARRSSTSAGPTDPPPPTYRRAASGRARSLGFPRCSPLPRHRQPALGGRYHP